MDGSGVARLIALAHNEIEARHVGRVPLDSRNGHTIDQTPNTQGANNMNLIITITDRPADDLTCDRCDAEIKHGEAIAMNPEHPLGEEIFCSTCISQALAKLPTLNSESVCHKVGHKWHHHC